MLDLEEVSLDKATLNLLKYVIEPYCNSNNIDLEELIKKLYNNYILSNDNINHSNIEIDDPPPKVSKGRGRPKGSKNKPKDKQDKPNLVNVLSGGPKKRGRGRPKGSKNRN